jgi:hypothetical protein
MWGVSRLLVVLVCFACLAVGRQDGGVAAAETSSSSSQTALQQARTALAQVEAAYQSHKQSAKEISDNLKNAIAAWKASETINADPIHAQDGSSGSGSGSEKEEEKNNNKEEKKEEEEDQLWSEDTYNYSYVDWTGE